MRRGYLYILSADDNRTLIGFPEDVQGILIWSAWKHHNHDRCVVGQEKVGHREVSTVFIGHGHMFETMIFSELDGDPLNDKQWRHESWDEARAFHEHLCEELRTYSDWENDDEAWEDWEFETQ